MKKFTSLLLVMLMLFGVLFTTPAAAVSVPAKPLITSLSNTDNGLLLVWNTVQNATGYRIYKRGAGQTSWTYLKTVTSNSYLDTYVASGKYYRYTVKAVNGNVFGAHDVNGKYTMRLANPYSIKASNETSGVAVSWGKINGANGYRVYRRGAGQTYWSYLGTTSVTKFVDSKVASGNYYRYTVRAAYNSIFSSYSTSGALTIRLANPYSIKAQSVNGGIKVNWGKINGATAYRVYRRGAGQTSWTYLGAVSGTTYTDRAVSANNYYRYTVRAARGNYYSWFDSNGAVVKYIISSGHKVNPYSPPVYNGSPYVTVNGNIPGLSKSDRTSTYFEKYSALDSLGRCGVAFACLGYETMPTSNRGDISSVKPSGWHSSPYNCVEGGYLYNRCHLIGFQLSAENANSRNLITGTRYMNVDGMLPYENMVADYIEETGNHVLYRVTPIFKGNELVARGVQIEAYSVEDNGEGISFNVYCFNVQPGIVIDYASGDSYCTDGCQNIEIPTTTPATNPVTPPSSSGNTYILNTNSMKFHYPHCSSADDIATHNRQEYTGNRDYLISQGYSPCKRCNP